MIDIEKACEIATKELKEPFIDTIIDVGSGFVIGTVAENGDIAEQFPLFVCKDSGKTEFFFVPGRIEELKKGKFVKIPSKYIFKK